MKRQAYSSAPLPITWTRDEYIQGTRDHAYLTNKISQVDLGVALDFVRSSDPRYKLKTGGPQSLDYIPSEKIVYKIDSAAVMQNKAICPEDVPFLPQEITIDLSGKTAIGKEALTILDMIHTNNWKRPIYYAVTVTPEQFVHLDPFFQKTGLAYRIVPFNTREAGREIDTERMYDNVMNKFRWGGVDKSGIYIDENVMRMCKSYRGILFGPLASALLQEGKPDKAMAALDKCMQVLPPENIPYNFLDFTSAETYLELGAKDKGEQILNGVAENSMRTVRWLYRLKAQSPHKFAALRGELEHHLAVVQNSLAIGIQHNPDYGKAYRDEFSTYRAEFTQQQQPANR
jgi:hypothetical protein